MYVDDLRLHIEELQREKEYTKAISDTFERDLEQANAELSDFKVRLEIAEDKVVRTFAILGEQRSSYSLKGGKLHTKS